MLISIWWAVVAFAFGGSLGVLVTALLVAGSSQEDGYERELSR